MSCLFFSVVFHLLAARALLPTTFHVPILRRQLWIGLCHVHCGCADDLLMAKEQEKELKEEIDNVMSALQEI